MSSPPEFCSIERIATEIDCSISTVREYTNRGLLPQPYKKGSLVRWKWSEVDAAMHGTNEGVEEEQDPILRAVNGS